MKLRLAWCASLILLAACTVTKQHAASDFKPPTGAYKLVVMRPDINASLLTAGGGLEPREDWSEQASRLVLAELKAQQASRGAVVQVVTFDEGQSVGDPQLVAKLDRLHEAVGRSIQLHKYTPGLALPTKANSFDWTLGQLAVDYGKSSEQDYALFLFADASFSSGGRMALQAVSILGCAVGVCYLPPGGQQIAFVSLVDLKSGRVVWYNHVLSTIGDIRTQEGAQKLVENLFKDMKSGSPQKT